jgi:hypothetical protein
MRVFFFFFLLVGARCCATVAPPSLFPRATNLSPHTLSLFHPAILILPPSLPPSPH